MAPSTASQELCTASHFRDRNPVLVWRYRPAVACLLVRPLAIQACSRATFAFDNRDACRDWEASCEDDDGDDEVRGGEMEKDCTISTGSDGRDRLDMACTDC